MSDSISAILENTKRDDEIYNDLLDLQSLILSFKGNNELLKEFSEIQLLVFQNKRSQAIAKLVHILSRANNDIMMNDLIILQLSYLLILQDKPNDALMYLDTISHQTIFAEFAYILKAEIFNFILIDKQNAADIYIDFLAKYPLSIFYDDIRLQLRELTN